MAGLSRNEPCARSLSLYLFSLPLSFTLTHTSTHPDTIRAKVSSSRRRVVQQICCGFVENVKKLKVSKDCRLESDDIPEDKEEWVGSRAA